MKKVLLATTALALSAGVAYAEVSISGDARMGLVYTGKVAGKAAVQGVHTEDTAALVNAAHSGVQGWVDLEAGDAVTVEHMADLNAAFTASAEAAASAKTGALYTAAGGGNPASGWANTAANLNALNAVLAASGVPTYANPGAVAQAGYTGVAQAIATARVVAVAAQDADAIAALDDIAADIESAIDVDAVNNALAANADALAAIAAASGTPAVAAVDSKISLEKRMTVNMSGSVETTSGLTFGAALNLRSNERSGTVTGGARVHMATNGLEVAVGNIYGAIDSMPGLYKAVGLTGLGWGGLVANTAAKGSFAWDSYSSSGNGPEGVEVIYSAGSFTGHLSYTDTDLGSFGNTTAAYVSYAMGDWTVAVAMQDSDVNANDKTIVTVGGKVGDFGVGFAAADNDGESKIALNGSATMGATTISAYITDEESAANNPMGVGFKHDLGGASLVGGVARTAGGQTLADVGVSFSF